MPLRRTDVCVLLATAVALAGCGGNSARPAPPLDSSPKAVAADPTQEPGPGPATAGSRALHTAAAERQVLVARADAQRAAQERLVRSAVAVALDALRAPHAKVEVGPGGSSVRIWLNPQQACAVGAEPADRLPGALVNELRPVKSAELSVTGSTETAFGFITDHCHKPANPLVKAPAEPPAVIAETGSYFAVTKPFTIHARHWTLEYSTSARYFRALVVQGNRQILVAMPQGGIGKRSFAGPGRFQVRVSSSGKWTIRVLAR